MMTSRLVLAALAAGLISVSSAPGAQARVKQGHILSHSSAGGADRGCLSRETRNLLGRIESRFGHVQLISTCRPGARIASTGKVSKHASGQAVDFSAPSGKKQELVRWLIANHKSGGTMTYRDMNHIHVDVGYHFVSLGSASRG